MRYFLVAGEASGEAHAARLIEELKALDAEAKFAFLGGDKMQAVAGVPPVVHIRQMAFMGFVNVAMNAGKIRRFTLKAKEAFSQFNPDHLILVDYPGFNLRFAKYVKHHFPHITVHYYIAPKLWAWKEWRIKDIKRYVDRMYTIFPFESQYFKSHGYEVTYVGNPTVEQVAEFVPTHNATLFRERYQLDARPIVALLPGSRVQEVKPCLEIMGQVVNEFPEFQFVAAQAPGADDFLYEATNIRVVKGSTYELLASAHTAVVKSGTATLETALLGVPQVVVYSVFGGRAALLFKKLLIKTKHVSLVNIIARKEVVKELIASDFNEHTLKNALSTLLYSDEYRNTILAGYRSVREDLGVNCAAKNCASMIYNYSSNVDK